ncbi:MAG: universal stress protein UspA [Proteobacteria bacterium]|nr:MAG: universal stress protein UspA [Pseudomonadota bacterium]
MTRKWLVAYDFSRQAEAALEMAADLLRADGEVLLLHVHRPLSTAFGVEFAALSPAFRDVDATISSAARDRLEEAAQAVRDRHPGLVIRTVVAAGYPAEHIVTAAREEGVDRIIVGSHGRRGLRRVFLGSVAERVVREADRTVTVVKGVELEDGC